MRRLFFVLLAISACAAPPTLSIEPGVAATPRERPPPSPWVPAPVHDTCIIHGSGSGGLILVSTAEDTDPVVSVSGRHDDGIVWRDVPGVHGDVSRARVEVSLSGVKLQGFAPIRGRAFRALATPRALDAVARPRAGASVSVEGALGGEAVVEISSPTVRPQVVRGAIACGALAMSGAASEDPVQGRAVRPVGTWVHVRRTIGGAHVRAIDGTFELVQTTERPGWRYVRARNDDVDVEGWVASSEVNVPSGYGIGRIGHGERGVMTSCPKGHEQALARDADLHVGVSPGAVIGRITSGTKVTVVRVSGEWAAVAVPPCSISPAKASEAFWVHASDLE